MWVVRYVTVTVTDPVTGRQTRHTEQTLDSIEGGVAVMPWNPTNSTITPEGETEDVTYIAFARKDTPLTQKDVLKDSVGSAGRTYQVKYLKEWADYYELGLN